MQGLDSVFFIIILIMSVVGHEVAHGYAALYFGDKTAKYAGRLTLNPIKHLDPLGSVIIPLVLILVNAGFVFGWAKPVPYNPANLRGSRYAEVLVASAGIIVNIIVAVLFAIVARVLDASGLLTEAVFSIISGIVLINLVLAFFNLIPVPPLDGSKILFGVLPPSRALLVRMFMERYSFILLIVVIFFLFRFVEPLIFHSYAWLLGL